MPKRITRESVLNDARNNIADFLKTKAFQQSSVNNPEVKKLAPEYLLEFTSQMYDIWGQHPRTWTIKAAQEIILIGDPYWELLEARLYSLDWLSILSEYVTYLMSIGEIKGTSLLPKRLEGNIAMRFRAGMGFQSYYLLAKLRQIQHVPPIKDSDQFESYRQAHISDVLLFAENSTFEELQDIYHEMHMFQMPLNTVADLLRNSLSSLYPKNAEYKTDAFESAMDALLETGKDYSTTLIDRILIAASIDDIDLKEATARKQFLNTHQTVLDVVSSVKTVQSKLEKAISDQSIPALQYLKHDQMELNTAEIDIESLGFQPVNDGRYQYLDPETLQPRYLSADTMKTLKRLFGSNTRPKEMLEKTQQARSEHKDLDQATTFAIQTDVLVPFLPKEQSLIKSFTNNFDLYFQDTPKGFKLTVKEVRATLNHFYNDMFIQTGRVPHKWNGQAFTQILFDSHLVWHNMKTQEVKDTFEVMSRFVDFIARQEHLSQDESMQTALSDWVDKLVPFNDFDDGYADVSDEFAPDDTDYSNFIVKLSYVFNKPNHGIDTNLTAFLAEHDVAAILLADGFNLTNLIDFDSNVLNLETPETYNNFRINWFFSSVKPTYTKVEAAKLTNIPSTLSDNDFWNSAASYLLNSQVAVPTKKRFQIALQHELDQSEPPTSKQIEAFANKYDKCREALDLTKAEFKTLLAPDPQLLQASLTHHQGMSLDAARKLAKKRRKRR
ncbi:hypothetical protein [Secundilactobacillus folii]|uniref:Uncharacterized protein n=1 Tax=Secundilactobacillus folii TaxID=2678357 RepID=A0A7X2XTV4_9LACO|nr:hypothetical protein [Secundilactobacillus folii]MTV81607.1 hypothetical protein [Secundilactobacillus folii]